MKLRHLGGVVAAMSVLAGAGSANAITVDILGFQLGNLNGALLHGNQYILDFDGIADPDFAMSASTATNYVSPAVIDGNGYGTLIPGVSAPPPIPYASDGGAYHYENTNYYTITSGGSATLSALNGRTLSGFSFYFGSPDEYNHVTFTFTGAAGSVSLSGEDLWTTANMNLTGDQNWGARVYYGFSGGTVDSITFSATGNSFEIDGFAANVAGVPEPTTWALMILGFGGAGAMLRANRRRTVAALA